MDKKTTSTKPLPPISDLKPAKHPAAVKEAYSDVVEDTEQAFAFKVDKVETCKFLPQRSTGEQVIRHTIESKAKFEDFSHRGNTEASFIGGDMPGFITAIHTAYQSHYPLKLTPSDFILLIGQGLSKHINRYPEELRSNFVSHEGKETIIITRDGFVKGSQNDWSTVFGDFANEIKKIVKADIYDVVVDDTAGATKTTRIVSELTLMDCTQSYFNYEVHTICGIPMITLEGKKEDWEKVKQKVNKLVEINKDDCLRLNWWLNHLIPVIDEVCDTAINRVANSAFWSSIYKYYNRGSGGPFITGWCTVFFPHLKDKRNKELASENIKTNLLPKQISDVPFIWKYLGTGIPMNFYGGFMGAEFSKTDYSVRTAYFWSVAYDESKDQKKSPKKR